MNVVIVDGNLARDPNIRSTKTGRAVASFTVGTNETYTTPQGDQRQITDWVNIVAWGKWAEIVANYCHKGTRVHVTGRYTTRSYDDQKTGQKRWITEVTANFVAPDISNLEPSGGQNFQNEPQQNNGFNQFGEAYKEPQPMAQQNMFPAGNTGTQQGSGAPFDEEIPF